MWTASFLCHRTLQEARSAKGCIHHHSRPRLSGTLLGVLRVRSFCVMRYDVSLHQIYMNLLDRVSCDEYTLTHVTSGAQCSVAHSCVACRRYANHLCDFSSRAWQCSLCGRLNDYTSLHNRRCAAVGSCMSTTSSCLCTFRMNVSSQQRERRNREVWGPFTPSLKDACAAACTQ